MSVFIILIFYMFENFGKGKGNDSVTWWPAAKVIALTFK